MNESIVSTLTEVPYFIEFRTEDYNNIFPKNFEDPLWNPNLYYLCEISSSHGSEYEVKICLLGCKG
jgi:hypothetical protein